ncbi:MAG: TonB-dependent receptor [Ignavibacteria bacterium]|nr:TonB-dependent receptor [Ignavibacteria bacterium]
MPKNLFKINLNLNYLNSGLNLFYVFTGKRFTDQENIGFLPANDLIEGNIYHKFIFNKVSAQIKLEVNNILNTDYQIIAGYPMALRNFKASVSLEY